MKKLVIKLKNSGGNMEIIDDKMQEELFKHYPDKEIPLLKAK